MSGLSRTPGKRVRVNSPSGVRIPLSPPQLNQALGSMFGPLAISIACSRIRLGLNDRREA
jgi:hypothetical protein